MSDSDGLFPAAELEHVDPVDGGVEAGAGVNKRFRTFEPAAVMLAPPSLDEWLPQNHLSRFIADIVETQLDLQKFYASYAKTKEQPPHDPRLMVRVVLADARLDRAQHPRAHLHLCSHPAKSRTRCAVRPPKPRTGSPKPST